MADEKRKVRVFVSSPGDVAPERRRVDAVAAKLNREYEGLVSFEAVLWEDSAYKADSTFQAQIPEAAAFDIVASIFWTRVGTELPADFARMPDGRPYLSGTVYELLTALQASKQKGVPDVYVFRKTADAALPTADAQLRRQAEAHLDALEAFWSEWFKSEKGQFKAAYQVFVTTDDFEQQLERLFRQWLQSHDLLGPRLAWPKEKGSPFRGLASFEAEHAPVFFGRDRAIDEARRRFAAAAHDAPFLLIVGASGSGKSSLARAGVIPRLTTPGVVAAVDFWRAARMKPSEGQSDPLLALATALFAKEALPELGEGDFPNASVLAGHFRRGGEAVAQPVIRALERAAAAAGRERHADRPLNAALVLLVDQLEELFARGISDADRSAFAETLAQLSASGRVWIVATLRADSYELAIREPKLKALKEAGATFDLGPPGPAELADIVRAPARAAGLIYEVDPAKGALDDRILADAASPDSLPLLQFALQQLYERRVESGDEARLTHEAYDALGGLAGAIAAEAERVVAPLRPEALGTLPRLLRRLAEPSRDGRTLLLREALISEAQADPAEAELLEVLKAAFVVITGTDAQGRATARLAHAAVFDSWPRAKEAAQANREFLRVRAEVEDALRLWRDRGRPSDRLIRAGVPLAEAEDLVGRFTPELPADLIAYVRDSGARARLRLRMTQAAAVVFAIVAVAAIAGGVIAFQARQEAVAQRDRAEQAREAVTMVVKTTNSATSELNTQFLSRHIQMDLLNLIADPLIQGYSRALKLDPSNAVVYVSLGSAYRWKGDYRGAIEYFKHAIDIDPKYAQAYRGRGIVFNLRALDYVVKREPELANRDFDQAIEDLDQAIQLDPKNAGAYLQLGLAYLGKQDNDRALKDFSQAIELDPNNKYNYLERAFAYRGRGDYDRAFEDFDRAIQIDQKDPQLYMNRADTYENKHDFEHAIQDYDRAIQLDPSGHNYRSRGLAYQLKHDYDRAIKDFDEAIRLDPKEATYRSSRGNAYNMKGDYDRAIQDLDQAIQLDPKNALAYTTRGNAYFGKRDFDRAIQDLDQAIQLDPKNALAYTNRGNAYSGKRDFDRAIQDFDQAIKLNPKNAFGYWSRGDAYFNKGDVDRAIEDYDQAINLDAKNAAVYAARGNAYLKKNDYDRALEDLDQAIGLDPGNVVAHLLRGACHERKGDHDRALEDAGRAIQELDQAVGLQPNNASAYVQRGFAYEIRGDYDRAIQDHGQAITLDPKNVDAYRNRGNTYVLKGDYDRALHDYDQAIVLDPANGRTYRQRGLASFDQGEFKAGATALMRANELEVDASNMILRYLARERVGEDGAAELEANAARLKSNDWPRPVIELYLGKISPEEFLSAAGKPEERCEAQFYVGEWSLLRGDRAAAATALRTVADTCPKLFFDYVGAVAELKRMTTQTGDVRSAN